MNDEPGAASDAIAHAGQTLCPVDAIPDNGARELFLGPRDDPFHIVLFRQAERVFVYRNRCPHFLLPLNAGPGRFILLKDGLVMCAWHSAVFRIVDGVGVDGPCMGGALEPIAVKVANGTIILDEEIRLAI